MTSGHYINYVAFVLVCLILMTLPFLPALQEWRHPSDSEALPISPNYSSDIDYFAKRLQADAAARLGQGSSTGYESFDFVSLPLERMDWLKAPQRLISKESLVTPAPVRTTQALYVDGNVQVGAEVLLAETQVVAQHAHLGHLGQRGLLLAAEPLRQVGDDVADGEVAHESPRTTRVEMAVTTCDPVASTIMDSAVTIELPPRLFTLVTVSVAVSSSPATIGRV